MQKWSKQQNGPLEMRFLLFDRFSNLCLANCLEPLRAANDFARQEGRANPQFRWQFLTLGQEIVHSSSGLPISPQGAAEACEPCDYLLVLASYEHLRHDTTYGRSLLRRLSQKARFVIGFDTSPWLLAAAGLLDGKQATIHYDLHDAFAERFLQTEVTHRPIIQDGRMITCAGAHSSYQCMRQVISHEVGENVAVDIDHLFLQSPNGTAPGGRAQHLPASVVQRALALMQDHIERPLSLADIAKEVACPPKSLSRRFQLELGTSPGVAYRHLRLTQAYKLCENAHLSVGEIALRTGYESPAALTRAFKIRYGRTPRMVRAGALLPSMIRDEV